MTKTLWVPGRPTTTDKPRGFEAEALLEEEVIREIRITPGSRSRAAVDTSQGVFVDVEDDDILEIELDDDHTVLFTTAGLYEKDLEEARLLAPESLQRSAAERSLPDDVIAFTGLPGRDLQTRGIKAIGIRLLRVLRLKPAQEVIAGKTVREIIAWREGKLFDGRPGVYRVNGAGGLTLLGKDDKIGAGESRPCLVFIHGTASSTEGSFGGLFKSSPGFSWKSLFDHYQGHVYALEHRSLSASPIENAVDLAEALAEKAQLHLVSHSRGGLVGELLCLQPEQMADLSDFRRPGGKLTEDDEEDRKKLRELRKLLEKKRPKVTRFVRVACPARGTSALESKRLDLFFSVLYNAVGFGVSGPVAAALLGFIGDSVKTILQQKDDPEKLPGLEAQVPGSPLVRLLNAEVRSTTADLSVIAGDLRGGLFEQLLNLASHLFFWEHNDLVVDTKAMYGGLQRPAEEASFLFDSGPKVTHFCYFKNDSTRAQLSQRLRGLPDRFESLKVGTDPSRFRGGSSAETGPRPVVFLLPGIMGSHLAAGSNRIWLDASDLAKGRMRQLAIDASGVTAQAVMDRSYRPLVNYLEQSHEVVEFPFDWRRSVLEEGARLGEAVAAKLNETDQPIRLLAHSLGGLVCRGMMVERPGVWKRLCDREGGRLIQLGTPNRGSYTIPRLLLGREGILKMVALLDIHQSRRDLVDLIRRFPGILETLPVDGDHDFFSAGLWRQIGEITEGRWPAPDEDDLKKAKDVRRKLDDGLSRRDRILYVAGTAGETPHDLRLPKEKKVVFLGTTQGDGRVPYELGLLDGVRTWYMEAKHGALANHEPSFVAIEELLKTGSTNQLSNEPLRTLRAGDESFPLPEEDAVVFPDQLDLAAAALGFDALPRGVEEDFSIRTWVTHGDMAHARYPILAGHYEGDSVNGAEGYLNRLVDRRLSRREQAGVYPGPRDTADVVLVPGSDTKGALIVGLGRRGRMGARVVREGVCRAVSQYLLMKWELSCEKRSAEDRELPPESTGITSLLVGTGLGSDLQVRDSMRAVLEGVGDAMRRLRIEELDCPVRIDEVEFVEFFEEKAVEAAHALRRVVDGLGRQAGGGRKFVAADRMRLAPGGRRAAVGGAYEDSWFQPVIITRDERDFLRFVVLSDSSRTEVSVRPTQTLLVDRLMEVAMSPAALRRSTSSTLYELLLPLELKGRAMDQHRLLLVVDEHTSRYPWELLEPSGEDDREEPLAVRTPIVRQLQFQTQQPPVQRSLGRDVLVVGDPRTDKEDFPALKEAKREAELVASLLSEAFEVHSSIRETGLEVVGKIFDRPYRVLHVAAHGTYNAKEPTKSGIVLDDDLYLSATELSCLTNVPDLVFLNCCYLARVSETDTPAGRGFNELTASVAVQLMESGVKAVVAAGWAVADAAAQIFARTFYERMLSGWPFGEAVLEARQVTYRAYRGVNTWGAYQAYGDPAFRLAPEVTKASRADDQINVVSRREILDKLRQLVRQAGDRQDHALEKWAEERESWRKRLENLEEWMGDELEEDGELLALAGEAWYSLGAEGKARERIKDSLRGENPDVASLRALELLCELELFAAETVAFGGTDPQILERGQGEDSGRPLQEILERLSQLMTLDALSETVVVGCGAGTPPGAAGEEDEGSGETPRRGSGGLGGDEIGAAGDGSGAGPIPAHRTVSASREPLLEGRDAAVQGPRSFGSGQTARREGKAEPAR